MDIFLTNNLTNKKEQFVPKDKKNIGMYVCGPTVYDDPHIGNARPLVVFDILFKVLKCKFGNSSVVYVRNITDVDDKIIEGAKQKKILINKLTTDITKRFNEDCDYLNCEKPSFEPKATENIPLMIDMIKNLLKKIMHMKITLTFILTYRVLKIMENYQRKMSINSLQGHELKFQKIKKGLKILFYGNHL